MNINKSVSKSETCEAQFRWKPSTKSSCCPVFFPLAVVDVVAGHMDTFSTFTEGVFLGSTDPHVPVSQLMRGQEEVFLSLWVGGQTCWSALMCS